MPNSTPLVAQIERREKMRKRLLKYGAGPLPGPLRPEDVYTLDDLLLRFSDFSAIKDDVERNSPNGLLVAAYQEYDGFIPTYFGGERCYPGKRLIEWINGKPPGPYKEWLAKAKAWHAAGRPENRNSVEID